MSRYVKVGDSDYKLSVSSGGTITLDTGNASGTVVITGNLEVQGNTTVIESETLVVRDNTIVINDGETSNGINYKGDRTAGIRIDRGTLADAQLLFNETIALDFPTQEIDRLQGMFVLTTDNNKLLGLRTHYISTATNPKSITSPDFAPLYVESSVIKVVASNYENNVNDADDIPNVQWVNDFVVDYVENTQPYRLERGNTVLRVFDDNVDGGNSAIRVTIDGRFAAEFTTNLFEVQDIRIEGNVITTASSNEDLILQSPGPSSVTIDDVLKIKNITILPNSSIDGVKIYSNNEGTGGTGIHFVNTKSTRDELVSRRKAFAYSMIF
jgi:hypothetical protein